MVAQSESKGDTLNQQHPLRAIRLDLKFSIEEVAELTGISATTIRRIESGDKTFKVNVTTAGVLARGLGTQAQALFRLDELSDLGRPALTGGKKIARRPHANLSCTTCGLEIPLAFTKCQEGCDTPQPEAIAL